jgi:hypothetical protein
MFLACLAAQLYLVFVKSFNWDEFLHFSQVYQLRAGTLVQPFQVLHARILWWAPEVSTDLVVQMQAARVFVWVSFLVTLGTIFGLARQFTNRVNAFFAAFAYLGAGYVFTHGFAIRADPLVTATLMAALFFAATGRLSLWRAIGVGVLIGVAGMMTVKAIFYAPCFAGIAWLRYRQDESRRLALGRFGVCAVAAVATFAIVYFYHTAGLAEAEPSARSGAAPSGFLRWLTSGLEFVHYTGREFLLAPIFVLCLALAPLAWRKAGLSRDRQIALAAMMLPLLTLLFYRNTFPYFFVFILAPAAVAIAPALGLLRQRVGDLSLSFALAVFPLVLTAMEPRSVIDRQRALIDYVHSEFRTPTGYLDYSAMISDYPRVLKYLTSGNGIKLYHEQGDAVVGHEIDRGNVAFIIANHPVLVAALEGRALPDTFLPADLQAMQGHYVRQWGPLWREGESIPAGAEPFAFTLRRGGRFVLAGAPATIDGAPVLPGEGLSLARGVHRVSGVRKSGSVLWRGDKLPSAPPALEVDSVFTQF